MSLLKANSVQIGQSSTATNNFTLSVPASPDGTIKLARGNSGATTADVLTVNASGAITGATISGATINSSTLNGGSITLGTAQNSTSGTAIEFTGIPSWVKRLTVMLDSVSLSSTASLLIQLGDSGGFENTGYSSTACVHATAGTHAGTTATNGFVIFGNAGTQVHRGIADIVKISGNSWIFSYNGSMDGTNTSNSGGTKTLSDTLDRVRVTTTSTDTFDAGSINIMYEG